MVVNVNCFLLPAEQEYCILDGDSKVLVTDGERAQMLGSMPSLKHLPLLTCRPENYKIPEHASSMEALVAEFAMRGKTAMPHESITHEDNCVIFFTSGTTGKPKGALHTQRGVVGGTVAARYNACAGLLRMGYGPEFFPKFNAQDPQAVSLVPTPLFHGETHPARNHPHIS